MSLTISELVGLQTSKSRVCSNNFLLSSPTPHGTIVTIWQYFNVAGLAILVFDYTITFEDEVRWVWGRSWDATRCVFIVSRYLPFAGAGMTAYVIHTLGIIAAEGPSSGLVLEHHMNVVRDKVLLILRTYAFWQGDKRVLYGLLAYGSVSGLLHCASRLSHSLPVTGGAPPGCLLIASRNGTFVYLFLLVFETVILSLTAYKRFRSYRGVRTPIMLTVYRDGMFYMFCIILITFSNMILDGVFPVSILSPQHPPENILKRPQITLHSVLASRIMFNLRKSFHYQGEDQSTNSVSLGDLRYYSPSDPQPQRVPIETTSSGSSSGAPV
ncbi:hypothetical protein JVU11DRAFT_11947 [Chiua virens]|nr:hypothetical protein JVU11DRAFT_11947 [Chiua virens]